MIVQPHDPTIDLILDEWRGASSVGLRDAAWGDMSLDSDHSTRNSDIVHLMVEDHDQMEVELLAVRRAIKANNRHDVLAHWTAFERDLLTHLESEEHYMLPAFAGFAREEARNLIVEHGRIREALLELGVAIGSRAVSFEQIDDMLELLHAHGQRECRSLYHWADLYLNPNSTFQFHRHLSRNL